MLQCGTHEVPPYSPEGEEGKFCFVCLENGIVVPTRERELVQRVIEGKKSINLQMKLWAEDLGILLMPDELKKYCQGYPEWVYRGTIEQGIKRFINEVGFIPSFMQL